MRATCLIRKEPYYRREAFERGLRQVGFTLANDRLPTGPEDWLVIWNRQHDGEIMATRWEAAGGTVIVAENGYLQKVDKTYYAISVHGHNGSGWFPVGPEDRLSKLGFDVRPLDYARPGVILICGQRGIGSKLMRSPPQWAEMIAKELKAHGIAHQVRPHPGNFAPKVPIEQDLKKASECWIWSSAAGVRALVEGVPVKHHAPRWIAAGGQHFGLHRMSHGQWHHEEIATGEPFARIITERHKASW